MLVKIRITGKRVVLGLPALSILGIVTALLVAYSGIYSIAASQGHPLWFEWFLSLGMRRSVVVNSSDITAPSFGDEELAPLGAAHFHTGCAVCHGAPGFPINPVFAHMLPAPPPLQHHVGRWKKRQLFWIVKHGLQYTGMPGWTSVKRDDEVWAVVAFLTILPELSDAEYQRLSHGNSVTREMRDEDMLFPTGELSGGELSTKKMSTEELLQSCNRCHGTSRAPATSNLIPRLGGQKKAYLARALQEYAASERQSGFMEPAANLLSDNEIEQLAKYYSVLNEATKPAPSFDQRLIQRGKKIAEQGDRETRLPACLHCHNATSASAFPMLNGQHSVYLYNQLTLWKNGGRDQSAYGKLMASIAKRMSVEQIKSVSAYFASLPPFGVNELIDSETIDKKEETP